MTYEYMAKDGILYHQMRVVYVKKKDRTRAVVIGTRNIDDLNKKEHSHLALKGRRVLLAEDNDLNAEIAMTLLSDYGFIVDRVNDGIACVKKVKENV